MGVERSKSIRGILVNVLQAVIMAFVLRVMRSHWRDLR